MAEAHEAVAFAFRVTPEGVDFNVNREAIKAVWYSGARSWRKRFQRFQNSFFRGVYPATPWTLIPVAAGVNAAHHYGYDVTLGVVDKLRGKWIPNQYVACTLVATAGWLAIVFLRRYTLKLLYLYHGWMYEAHRSVSWKTKLWTVLVRLLSGRNPGMFSYQNSIPHLPVPALKETMHRWLRSVRPLLDDTQYKRMETLAGEFERGVGRRFQKYLIMKSWISSNYVTDWWEEFVYLRGRSPLMVNSNFYGLDSILIHPTKVQAARAANIVHAAFLYRRELERETLTPIVIQNMIPLCSNQYVRQFNTTRVPGEETDKLVHYMDSKHVSVYHKGRYYKVFVYYKSHLLKPCELEMQFQSILDDPSLPEKGEEHLGSLTAAERSHWAKTRKQFFSDGMNQNSLRAIETAAFHVVLDEDDYEYDPEDHTKLDAFGRAMLHGDGCDRWYDKSFNVIFGKNGRMGLNTEHSWADAPVTAHLWEYCVGEDIHALGYREDGHTNGEPRFVPPKPIRLQWEFLPQCMSMIDESYNVATKLLNNVDLHMYVHRDFGKGFIKTCKISPDAFIQMAFQLAYFKDAGRFCLTYESSMTRLFRDGRTETVRSCTVESTEFVRAMLDESGKYTSQDKARLLWRAGEKHVNMYRDAMTGKGVDRHLFTLYVISKYLNEDSPFLKEILSEPWRLSTSQTPHGQTDKFDLRTNPNNISAGGGFGPVADDGYGVSYIIAGEDVIFFHISSKKSSPETDSVRFGRRIREAMLSMQELMVAVIKKKAE